MVGVVVPVDWESVTIASAFVLGSIVGTIATIVVMRALMQYLRPALRVDGDRLGGSQPPPTLDQDDSPPPS